MRIYEQFETTSENRLKPRSYYIPEGVSEYKLLNGEWRFAFFNRDIDVPEDVCVENIHLSDTLMTLSYRLKNSMDKNI